MLLGFSFLFSYPHTHQTCEIDRMEFPGAEMQALRLAGAGSLTKIDGPTGLAPIDTGLVAEITEIPSPVSQGLSESRMMLCSESELYGSSLCPAAL